MLVYDSPSSCPLITYHQRKPTGGRSRASTGAGARAKPQEYQRQQIALRRGPLRPKAQERFDAGPKKGKGPKGKDREGPGHVYVLKERGSKVDEYKVGETDSLDRRMKQLFLRNNTEYETKKTYDVNHRKFVEDVVHLDLDAVRIKPAKKKANGTTQSGGSEWFKAELSTILARANLVNRMYDARYA